MPHRPAHDPAQHVAAPLVGGRDAVGDEEGGGARVIGDHAHGDVRLLLEAVALARAPLDVSDEGAEEVGVVVGALALHHRRDPLEPHARVDGRFRQRSHPAARVAVELHEDQVPDLEPAVAIAGGPETASSGLLLRARQMVALVEVDLRARPARTRVSHRPEIVLLAQAQDAVVTHARDLLPEGEGVVVVDEHRGLEPVLGQPPLVRQELPAVGHRLRLEVIAEGEVAQHLEEGVVARGAPDVLEVVVLASGADALLGGGRAHVVAAFLAEEEALELHHAGIREEEGGVLGGHEGRGADHGVAVPLEVVEEALAEIVAGDH